MGIFETVDRKRQFARFHRPGSWCSIRHPLSIDRSSRLQREYRYHHAKKSNDPDCELCNFSDTRSSLGASISFLKNICVGNPRTSNSYIPRSSVYSWKRPSTTLGMVRHLHLCRLSVHTLQPRPWMGIPIFSFRMAFAAPPGCRLSNLESDKWKNMETVDCHNRNTQHHFGHQHAVLPNTSIHIRSPFTRTPSDG